MRPLQSSEPKSRVNGIVSLVSGTGGDSFRARYSVTTSGEIDRRWNLPVQGALAGTLRRQGSPNDAARQGSLLRPRCLNFYCVYTSREKRTVRTGFRADVWTFGLLSLPVLNLVQTGGRAEERKRTRSAPRE